MNFDKSPKKSSKESSRLSIDSNSTPPPNFQLPPEYWWNSSIPKNNLGSFDEDSQLLSSTPSGYIPDDGTFSPRPSNFKYTANLQSHYPPSTLDWGEPSFDVNYSDYSEGSIPQKIPAQNNIPAQNAPAQDNDLQYQDIDIWDDNIVNQLHLNNSLFNDESSNRDAVNIHQEHVPAQNKVRQNQNINLWSDDTINQLFSNSPPSSHKLYNLDESNIHQENFSILIPVRVPVPAPTIQVNGQQYVFDSLKNAFKYWVNNAGFSESTKTSYTSTTIGLIELLDLYGAFCPSQKAIDFYRDNYFEKDTPSRIRNFKSGSNQFFKWINENYIYNKIVPHENTENSALDRKAKFINMTLSNFLKRWTKTLKESDSIKIAYKSYVSNLITYLTNIPSFTPTIEDIKTYFKSHPKLMSPRIFSPCKAAIKSFLQFTESRGMVQRHDVYTFLDSNESM